MFPWNALTTEDYEFLNIWKVFVLFIFGHKTSIFLKQVISTKGENIDWNIFKLFHGILGNAFEIGKNAESNKNFLKEGFLFVSYFI